MAQKTLDFEKLIANPHAQICIAGGSSRSRCLVRGLVTSDVQIRGGNSFNSPEGSSVAGALNAGIASVNRGGSISGQLGGPSFSIEGTSLGNLQQTTKQWTGSETPVFSINMVFISLRGGDDVPTKVHQLYQTVFPEKISEAALRQPLGYSGTVNGTLAVQIGRWFLAPNQVMQGVNFTFSKEVTPDGGPLYATGTIEFTSFRAITFSEFTGFFKTLSRTSTGSNPSSKEVTASVTEPGTSVRAL